MEVRQVGDGEQEMVKGEDPHLVKHDVAAALHVLHDENPRLSGSEGKGAEPGAAGAGGRGLAGIVVAEKKTTSSAREVN